MLSSIFSSKKKEKPPDPKIKGSRGTARRILFSSRSYLQIKNATNSVRQVQLAVILLILVSRYGSCLNLIIEVMQTVWLQAAYFEWKQCQGSSSATPAVKGAAAFVEWHVNFEMYGCDIQIAIIESEGWAGKAMHLSQRREEKKIKNKKGRSEFFLE